MMNRPLNKACVVMLEMTFLLCPLSAKAAELQPLAVDPAVSYIQYADRNVLWGINHSFNGTGWSRENNVWYYYVNGRKVTGLTIINGRTYLLDQRTGAMKVNGWLQVGAYWYHSDGYGRVQTGWKQIQGKWYYLDPIKRGAMARNQFVLNSDGWHYVDGYGVMQKSNTVNHSGKTYHLNSWGVMDKSRWIQTGGKWYYYDNWGVRRKGLSTIGGKMYLLDPQSGAMKVNGWLQIGKNWYHSDGYGRVQTGWKQIQGNWYYLDSSQKGAMAKSRFVQNADGWHFVNSYGIMQKARIINHNGKQYYLNAWGIMVKNTTVSYGGKRYQANGWGELSLINNTGNSPTGEQYWVIIRERSGSGWKWLICFNSTIPSSRLYLSSEDGIFLNNGSGTTKYVRYLAGTTRGEWIKYSEEDMLSIDNTAKIIASNLDVYVNGDKKYMSKTTYSNTYWDYVREQGGD